MDEKALILRCQDGDSDAFSHVILQYERKAVGYALRMLRDSYEAEDAAQEAFLRAWRKIDTFDPDAPFLPWLLTIVNRVCLDMLRKKTRTGEHTHMSIHQTSDGEDEYALQIEDTAPGPHEMLRKKTAMEVLERAIDQLSQEHKTMILMRDMNGLEYDEIAKATGMALGTVKSRISRARIALRKILEKDRELFS